MSAAGVAACSNSPPPSADAFVNAAVGGGSMCSTSMSLQKSLQIGTAIQGHPNTVQNGGQDRNANVAVTCTVHPQGSGFDIQLEATEYGPNGGSLTISSPSGAGAVTTMTSSTGISATFVGPGGQYRQQTGCTITYLYDQGGSVGGVGGDQAVPTNPPIAAGRIWGHIKCPNAQYQPQPNTYCNAEADFTFEQCDQ